MNDMFVFIIISVSRTHPNYTDKNKQIKTRNEDVRKIAKEYIIECETLRIRTWGYLTLKS